MDWETIEFRFWQAVVCGSAFAALFMFTVSLCMIAGE